MRLFLPALRASVVVALLATPAFASTVTYTINGRVIAGGDGAGIFGGGDLTGDAFTAIETFDTSAAPWAYSNPDGSGATGGWSTNSRSFATVALTIGADTTRFSDYTSTLSSVGGNQFNSFVQSSSGPGKNDIGFYIASSAVKADYTRSYAVDSLSDLYAGYYTLNDADGHQVDWANFEVTGYSALATVPLPATAPLFATALLGLAAVGYGIKRKGASATRMEARTAPIAALNTRAD